MTSKQQPEEFKSVQGGQKSLGSVSESCKKYEKKMKQNFLVDKSVLGEAVIRGCHAETVTKELPTSAPELIERCEQLVQQVTATPSDQLKKQQLAQVVEKLRSMDEIDEEDFRKFHEKYRL